VAGAAQAEELSRPFSSSVYDPQADAALRYPQWEVAKVQLGWGLTEVLSLRERVILLERADPPVVQRCSLAHALAHLDLGHSPVSALLSGLFDRRQELEASLLAARRLIHVADLAEGLRWTASPSELAALLSVDPSTLSLRCARLDRRERALLESVRMPEAA
jgi:hypothetical protein